VITVILIISDKNIMNSRRKDVLLVFTPLDSRVHSAPRPFAREREQ